MCKMFQSVAKLITNDSDIDKELGSMHQSITIKIKNSVHEVWIAKTVVELDIKIFES